MNTLYIFISTYALCSLAIFLAVWDPKDGCIELVVSVLVGVTWPLWVLVRLLLILKMNP